MESYLGPNLQTILKKCGGTFSIPTVLSIAIQLIDRIEGLNHIFSYSLVLHSKNLIHRDLKPENMVIGREDISLIHLIDFGLTK